MFYDKDNVEAVPNASQQVVAAYRYDPFGVLLNKTGSLEQPFGFSTKRTDASTGIVFYQYRPYGPDSGTWYTRDPLGEAGGLNLYAFVGNNPVNWVDPWGLIVDGGVITIPTAVWIAGTIGVVALSPPGQEALGGFVDYSIHAVSTFPQNTANVADMVWNVCTVGTVISTLNPILNIPDQKERDKLRRDAQKTTPPLKPGSGWKRPRVPGDPCDELWRIIHDPNATLVRKAIATTLYYGGGCHDIN